MCGALAIVAAGCHGPASRADVQQTASDAAAKAKVETVKAKDQLADLWLATKIHSKYVGDRDIKATDISVSSQDGVVTLKGTVLNEPMRQLALNIAKNTDGVKQVVNQLDVQIAGPTPRVNASNAATPGAVATTGTADTASPDADARITADIQSKYFTDDRIKGRHIDVASNDGVVSLTGEVADDTERAQALLLARTTEGVKRVEDGLTVGTPASAPAPAALAAPAAPTIDADSTLSSKIRSQLSADTQLRGSSIDVTAKNGVVLLQGDVSSAAAKNRALSLARGTDGVTQVVDRIHVGRAKK
jgi:hyperosmotically inducible protein